MCNYLTKRGVQCSLSPNKDTCHIHKKHLIIEHKQTEIRNLNKTILKKSELFHSEVKTLKTENESLKTENESLKTQVQNFEKRILEMQEDFESYSKVKRYELLKSKLAKHVYDISDLYEVKYFCREHSNESTLSGIFGVQTDYWKYYNELRLERNKQCHIYG